jgi:hypothetical protein
VFLVSASGTRINAGVPLRSVLKASHTATTVQRPMIQLSCLSGLQDLTRDRSSNLFSDPRDLWEMRATKSSLKTHKSSDCCDSNYHSSYYIYIYTVLHKTYGFFFFFSARLNEVLLCWEGVSIV